MKTNKNLFKKTYPPFFVGFKGLLTESHGLSLGIRMGNPFFSLSPPHHFARYYHILEHGGGGRDWAVCLYLNSAMQRIQVPANYYSIKSIKAM